MVLVIKLDIGFLQSLVQIQLFLFCAGLGIVSVVSSHVVLKRTSTCKPDSVGRAVGNVTNAMIAILTHLLLATMLTESASLTLPTKFSSPTMTANVRSSALHAIYFHLTVSAYARPAAVNAVDFLSPVIAEAAPLTIFAMVFLFAVHADTNPATIMASELLFAVHADTNPSTSMASELLFTMLAFLINPSLHPQERGWRRRDFHLHFRFWYISAEPCLPRLC
jgi:hypothetical protein